MADDSNAITFYDLILINHVPIQYKWFVKINTINRLRVVSNFSDFSRFYNFCDFYKTFMDGCALFLHTIF